MVVYSSLPTLRQRLAAVDPFFFPHSFHSYRPPPPFPPFCPPRLWRLHAGNTCYLNATLQCFKSMPEMVPLLEAVGNGGGPNEGLAIQLKLLLEQVRLSFPRVARALGVPPPPVPLPPL